MWKITKEHEPDLLKSRVGYSEQHSRVPIIAAAMGWESEELPSHYESGRVLENGTLENLGEELPLIRFRTKTDDGEVVYEGLLHDDDECLNQSAAYDYSRDDYGTTIIEVYRDGEWVQEIA